MLATTCEICGTVELQDKQGKTYCVACEEIDCEENSKDNPAVNPRAARNQIAEGQLEDLESQIITDRNQVCLYIILKNIAQKNQLVLAPMVETELSNYFWFFLIEIIQPISKS